MIVTYRGMKCKLAYKKYANGQTAIRLVNDKEVVAVATTQVSKEIENDEVVIIKHYGNTDMIDVLVKYGVVSEPLREISLGYIDGYVCKLLKGE